MIQLKDPNGKVIEGKELLFSDLQNGGGINP